ncbi:MAG TPA: PadR family transcriptional regulator, partial [Coriobacteriia bacterium]
LRKVSPAMERASAKELFILGRVSLRPTYGHEIMRTLRESRADLWVELSEKHVYYILRKLDREGLVTATGERTGRLPARKVHTITDTGRSVLAEMMIADSLVRAVPYSEFDVLLGMLAYTDLLDDATKSDVLLRRRAVLQEQLDGLAEATEDSAFANGPDGFPRLMLAKVLRNVSAELEWLDSIAAHVASSGWASLKPTLATADNPLATD